LMGAVWVTLKLVFYIAAVRHLRKPEVRAHLDAAPQDI